MKSETDVCMGQLKYGSTCYEGRMTRLVSTSVVEGYVRLRYTPRNPPNCNCVTTDITLDRR